MSGHSKWSTIKHKKAAEDSKKGKVFGEVSRMIRVAVKSGKTGDPNMNPSLRLALEKARAVNMPNENVARAIAKGLGSSDNGKQIEEVCYEGFGPQGVGLLIFAVTDNRNRTGAEIRSILERGGGTLAGPGAASYLFEVQADGKASIKIPMPIADATIRERVNTLLEQLEEREDVEMVSCNLV